MDMKYYLAYSILTLLFIFVAFPVLGNHLLGGRSGYKAAFIAGIKFAAIAATFGATLTSALWFLNVTFF